MKLSEIVYERPNINETKLKIQKLAEQFKISNSAEEQISIYKKWSCIRNHINTLSSLAYIRFSLNTEDEFYSNEVDFYDENLPLLEEDNYIFICNFLNSDYTKELENEFGDVLFRNYKYYIKSFSPDIIKEIQEDNKLISEYSKLLASAQILFDGKMMNISQLGKYKECPDSNIRFKAFDAQGKWMHSKSEQFDLIFDKMVKIRTIIAHKLDFKNYAELSIFKMGRLDYNLADIEKFRNNVLKTWVPFVTKLKARQSNDLDINPIRLCDDTIWFKKGNPTPKCTVNEMFENGKKMYHEMSESTSKFIDFMLENDLFDVIARKGKSTGGYCSDLPEYKMPFIFANFNGTYGDVDVLTHEAGHAYASYEAFNNIQYDDLRQAGMETCEVHSMSMEFFSWKWMDYFFKDRSHDYKYMHLANAVSFIPYGTMVDYFQQIVYTDPDMTPAQRNQLWLKLEKQFRPYMSNEGIAYMQDGGRWQYQAHIYESPFYYIDYCLAQSVAFEFLSESTVNYKDTFNRYVDFLKNGGTMMFRDLIKNAGLQDIFEDDYMKNIINKLEKILLN